jgi:hypothetical protein
VETLADRVAREGPFNELDAVGWAIRLAKRIESMHALGVIHGSVSPQCVLLEGKDRTALAYLVDVRRTSSGPGYHSPERSAGGGLSQADDTWAVACTLYAALTGGPPFAGATDAETRQKILNSTPAPLAVFDVGDDDLQRVLDDAFAREISQRSTSVTTLRKALEEWHPDPSVGGLPGLDDEDTGAEDEEELEEERTIMRAAPAVLPGLLAGTQTSGAIPAPRAPPPGAGAAISPFASPRTGPAARAVPAPRASQPGVPRGMPPGATLPRVSPPAVAPPRAPSLGGFPPPAGPPPGLTPQALLPYGEDDEEDEKTMMRSAPDHFAGAPASRSAEASRSGPFPAAPSTKSGAFPAHVLSAHADDDVGDEATRMMQAPAFDEDDDEQATIMRSSASSDEVERITAAMSAADAAREARPRPAGGVPAGLASTVAFDAMGFAPPPNEGPRTNLPGLTDEAEPAADIPIGGPPPPAPDVPSGTFPVPHELGAAPLALPVPAAVAAPAPAPRRTVVWVVLVLLVLVALATFAFLRLR